MGQATLFYIDDAGIGTVSQLSNVSGVDGVTLMLTQTITLTNDQIKALPTTGVEVVPAITGSLINFINGVCIIDATGGAYSNITGTRSFYFTYQGVAGTLASNEFDEATQQAFQDASAVHILVFPTTLGPTTNAAVAWPGDTTSMENKAILFKASSSGGNLTGGHANNTVKLVVYYTVVNLS